MFRFSSIALCGSFLIGLGVAVAADPADVDSFKKTVAVQTAISRANDLLRENKAQKAVEILEEQLPNVNGNKNYLVLLRDAYRAYIRDLYLAGQPDRARNYVDRLGILDPAAAEQFLHPKADPRQAQTEPEPAKQEAKIGFPKFKLPSFTNPFVKKEEPKEVPKLAVFRGVAEDSLTEDPFDRKHQRETSAENSKVQDYLTRGAGEFARKQYKEARLCFEQAYQLDKKSMESCREPWAYCMIKHVSDQLDAPPGGTSINWADMHQEVSGAIRMAPKLADVGQKLLTQLDQRARTQAGSAPRVFASVSNVKHLGPNAEGWQVARTPYFLIFHRHTNEFAEQVAASAELTRVTMYQKWFGHDGIEWQEPCELIVHPSVSSYSQMTGQASNVPGHSRIESDLSGRVISRRMDLRNDITSMMEAVLPHETTHVVLAGMFETRQLPRWVDEGIAVLSEPNEKIDLHRRNLLKHHHEGQLFGLKELMELHDYPHPRRISAFYAQSVVLVEFLANQRGPKVFTDYVRDGLRQGYEAALQRHYNLTFAQLEQQWIAQVLNNSERLAAKK